MLHVCKGFLRTHSSGLESVPGGKERTSALEHTRHCRLWEGPLSLGQPSHPKVRSNWDNRAIKTALPLCSSQREGCGEGRVLVGFVQCPNWEGAREHLRLPILGPFCILFFLLPVFPLDMQEEELEGVGQSKPRGSGGTCMPMAPWPPRSL